MTSEQPKSLFDQLHPPSLIVAAVMGVISTFLMLEHQGKIKHSNDKDQFALSEYRAILVDPEAPEAIKVSPKPSNQHAQCYNGYLFIRSDVNNAMQGILVDYKNRGIRCPNLINQTEGAGN